MFQTRWFIFKKTVVYTVMVYSILQAEVTIKAIYKIFMYKMFQLVKYIVMNIRHGS